MLKKKGQLYYPSNEFQKKAWVNDKKIYKEAQKDPVKFWEKLAKDLFWFKPWHEGFSHKPPYFQWFLGGKMNITANIFEENSLGFDKLKKKPALIWEPESLKEKPKILTYGELLKEVNKFANVLLRLGVKKGDKVGIYLPMIPEIVISMLACARIGAVHLVVFSAFPSVALKTRLDAVGAKILITADGYYRRGQLINLKKNAEEGIKDTKIEKTITVRRAGNEIIFNPGKDLWWHDLVEKESTECRAEAMDSEDLFFILPESGTTGRFLPICHTVGGYAVQAKWTGKAVFDFKQNDILWCTSDPGWITGHTYTVYSPLINGITTLIYEGAPDFPTSGRWAGIIEKYKITIFYTAPTAIRMFRKHGSETFAKYNFESLKLLGSVGELIDESTWIWYFKEIGKEKCPIVDTYWQTETGGIIISSLPGIGPFKPGFTGLPLPGIRAEILNKKGNLCKENEPGNLVLFSPYAPGLLRGIYNDPGKYLETYWSKYEKNIYFTSDTAIKDENGLIRIIGRADDIIKVAGHRMSTGEMESGIAKHPDVLESAVIGVPDPIKGDVPVVFLIVKSQKSQKELKKEVAEHIKKEFGPIALPKEIYLVEDLPKTHSGKIMRRILKKLFAKEDLGDLSTLANAQVVNKLGKIIKEK